MIIENGVIRFKEKTAGKIDPETGHLSKAAAVEWSKPIPCQIAPVNRQLLVNTPGGERITTATYNVLLEEQPLPDSEQICLIDRSGKSLGEFSMIAPPEYLDVVCEIKIVV